MLQLGSELLRKKPMEVFDSKQKIIEIGSKFNAVNWWKEKISPVNELDIMIGDRNSDILGWMGSWR